MTRAKRAAVKPITTEVTDEISVTINGSAMTIEAELNVDGVVSASGKSLIHVSSRGNKALGNGMVLGLNVYSKK